MRVVAPSGPFPKEQFEAGLALLSKRYRVLFDDSLFSRSRYLAGPDERRARELAAALTDDSRAIFCARGGYGSMRLLPQLSLDKGPLKHLVGFSDITALHLALQNEGRASLHAPVMTQLGRMPHVADKLFHLLESYEPAAPIDGDTCVVKGVVEGPLVGGNLSVLVSLLGSPHFPELAGAVLLLEDIDERPYRLDRMWTHLVLSGELAGVAGIVLGDFTGCDEKDGSILSKDVLAELAREVGVPCASGFPIGHGTLNVPVPLGCRVRLDATAHRLSFMEAAVERGSHA